jgi:hypothetical protein
MQKKSIKGIIYIFLLLVAVLLAYLYYNLDDSGTVEKIEIDDDNTEIIVNKEDIEEIQSKLDQLDINLDDILNELEL